MRALSVLSSGSISKIDTPQSEVLRAGQPQVACLRGAKYSVSTSPSESAIVYAVCHCVPSSEVCSE
jgi:hypothetical protein